MFSIDSGHVSSEKEALVPDKNHDILDDVIKPDESPRDIEIRSESDDEFCDSSADIVVVRTKNDSLSHSESSSLSTESLSGSPSKGRHW